MPRNCVYKTSPASSMSGHGRYRFILMRHSGPMPLCRCSFMKPNGPMPFYRCSLRKHSGPMRISKLKQGLLGRRQGQERAQRWQLQRLLQGRLADTARRRRPPEVRAPLQNTSLPLHPRTGFTTSQGCYDRHGRSTYVQGQNTPELLGPTF